MQTSTKTFSKTLGEIWSPTSFESSDVLRYAMPRITAESQRGVAVLGMAALIFLLSAALLSAVFKLGTGYVYTYALLAALSLHVYVSSWTVVQLKGLYLLATALLVICASSLVLVAHQSGKLDLMMLSSVAALFMLVPVVPWGLREAASIVCAIYFMFTASMVATGPRFSGQDFWLLQFLMLFAAVVSVTLVIRALMVRKNDLRTQFDLHQAHSEMQGLLDRDHLTGAWSRRFLETRFPEILARHRQAGKDSFFAVFDIDRFKDINDTFGHGEGDRVLQAIAASFASLCREDEYVVRMGGDEFALLLCGDDPAPRLHAALSTIRDPSRYQGMLASLPGFSIGLVSIAASRAPGLDKVYKMADEAQYQAKRAGGNRVVQYGPEGREAAPARGQSARTGP